MELKPDQGVVSMSDSHDLLLFGFGAYFQAVWKALSFHNQGMVAGGDEG